MSFHFYSSDWGVSLAWKYNQEIGSLARLFNHRLRYPGHCLEAQLLCRAVDASIIWATESGTAPTALVELQSPAPSSILALPTAPMPLLLRPHSKLLLL